MKKIFKFLTSLTVAIFFTTKVSACGIHYVRLSKDISKWDTNTLFSNSNLLQAIDDSKILVLKNSLTNFYKPCFDQSHTQQSELENIHKDLPNVYFLIDNNDGKLKYFVFIATLPIIYQAIINYETHTKITDLGLNSIHKIQQDIIFKYPKDLSDTSQIYVKNSVKQKVKKTGIITKKDIYQIDEKPDNNAWLLTKCLDSSSQTPGYVSVVNLMELTIVAKPGNIDNYTYFLEDKKLLWQWHDFKLIKHLLSNLSRCFIIIEKN